MAAENNIKATIEELQKALSANSIIGTPIEMEDKIIVPITKMNSSGSGSCFDLHTLQVPQPERRLNYLIIDKKMLKIE